MRYLLLILIAFSCEFKSAPKPEPIDSTKFVLNRINERLDRVQYQLDSIKFEMVEIDSNSLRAIRGVEGITKKQIRRYNNGAFVGGLIDAFTGRRISSVAR